MFMSRWCEPFESLQFLPTHTPKHAYRFYDFSFLPNLGLWRFESREKRRRVKPNGKSDIL